MYGPGSVQPPAAGRTKRGGAFQPGPGAATLTMALRSGSPDFNVADAYDSHTILTRKMVKERQPAVDRLLAGSPDGKRRGAVQCGYPPHGSQEKGYDGQTPAGEVSGR